jgi:RNA:NAD 2'-phosphotransferase (TPT1/KptA family)
MNILNKEREINMKTPKEYIVIAFTVQNLINDGYKFEEIDNKIAVTDDEGFKKHYTDKEFKEWILEKSLDY